MFYKGQTADLNNRIERHNNKREDFTSFGAPWLLIWHTEKATKSESVILESKLKNLNRKKLINFINKDKEGIAGPDAMLLVEQWSGC